MHAQSSSCRGEATHNIHTSRAGQSAVGVLLVIAAAAAPVNGQARCAGLS
jgi:hypothetical protein